MHTLQELIEDHQNFDSYLLNFNVNPNNFSTVLEKFVKLAKISADRNLLPEEEKILVNDRYFEEAAKSSNSLNEIVMKCFSNLNKRKMHLDERFEKQERELAKYILEKNHSNKVSNEHREKLMEIRSHMYESFNGLKTISKASKDIVDSLISRTKRNIADFDDNYTKSLFKSYNENLSSLLEFDKRINELVDIYSKTITSKINEIM